MSPIDPNNINLYHIVHVDKLIPILSSGNAGELVCDIDVHNQSLQGTTIGMNKIKNRRMNELTLNSHPGLFVGACVPLYFCPRSVMLYMFYRNNHPEITYRGGQEPIVHLVFNLMEVVKWASEQNRRWAFTASNAGSKYFEDYDHLEDLDKLDWIAIKTNDWQDCQEKKQAEFLVEKSLPWQLVQEIAVYSEVYYNIVCESIWSASHKPPVKIRPRWYY